jgi:ribosome-associated protein
MNAKAPFGRRPDAPADEENDNGYDRPSKSQLKRDMHALQDLGVELIGLSKDALTRVPMPEKLNDAVREARRITDHEGRRRQVQYVGKVMRGLREDEIAAMRRVLDAINGVSKAETARLHSLERMREKLLSDDAALTDYIRLHPNADPQEGRTLIRNTRREIELKKPPKYFRELFQWIKLTSEAANPGEKAATPSATDDEDGGIDYPSFDQDRDGPTYHD